MALRDRATFNCATAKWEDASVGLLTSRPIADERLKRCFDVLMSAVLLVFLFPLFFTISAILMTQGWPVIIRHLRVGRGGQAFPCYKFRTMVVDSDKVLQRHLEENPFAWREWEAARKLKEDPRVTALGRVMRKSSIDELPQLLNVLRGDMSLVGPRPIVMAEAAHYGRNIDRYYAVRPGLTGPWQVSGRSDVSYEQRVALDCAYVEDRSFRRDLVILAKTLPAVLAFRGSY